MTGRAVTAAAVFAASWAFAGAALVLMWTAGLPTEPLPGVFLSQAPPLVRASFDDIGITVALVYGPVSALILECYPALAENELSAIREAAMARFDLIDAAIIHRFGRLVPGETIMMVATLAPHRQAAFEGAEYLMDYLKTGAPFWKQEETPAGLRWVDARPDDDDARDRWTR